MQLLMVLVAGKDGRLLTPFSLWLDYMVARPTLNLDLGSQDLFYLTWTRVFLSVNNGKQCEESVLESSNLFDERVYLKTNKYINGFEE